jgi:methionine synthase II (cobalamin-independent)
MALRLHHDSSNADENPVTRQIYTNTFYRKPLIANILEDSKEDIVDTKFIEKIPAEKRKVILPSPFSLVYMSDGIHKSESGKLGHDVFFDVLFGVAKILNKEAKRLQKKKISFIQFNDPCIAYAEETVELWNEISESFEIAFKDIKTITSLHLYNGDVSKFLPMLSNLPVKRIGIDPFTTNIQKFIGLNFGKYLEVGVINSKNSLVEKPEAVAKYGKQIMEKINPSGLALVPNRPLELVPQKIAIEKIKSLAKAGEMLNNGLK